MRVSDLVDMLAAGATHDEILEDFPYLARRRHRAALAYAASGDRSSRHPRGLSLRFLIDAQLPPALVDRLASMGHRPTTSHVLVLGVATDREIWAYAGRGTGGLVTKDHDFADLTLSEPAEVAVVWIRLGNTTSKALWRALEPVLPESCEAITRGETLIEIA